MRAREHLRIDQQVSIVVDYMQKEADGYKPLLLICESLDISAGGFKIQVDKPLTPDAIYSIALKISGLSFHLVVQAKWVDDCLSTGACDSSGYCVGFKLLDSDGTDIVAFKQWVADQLSL